MRYEKFSPNNVKCHTLQRGEIYEIQTNSRPPRLYRFTKVTNTGFHFVDILSGEFLTKNPLYPSKRRTDDISKELMRSGYVKVYMLKCFIIKRHSRVEAIEQLTNSVLTKISYVITMGNKELGKRLLEQYHYDVREIENNYESEI